ncbi:hypothetical protein ACQKP5_18125 [Pseudomonas vancouverensis]|uniref:hypothetical protein n=1 Tax=Pseudomonas vancouverensis TaxID=95300 RepID=UPI003D02D6F2
MRSVIVVPGRPGFKALLWWFQGPDAVAAHYRFELDGNPLLPTIAPIPVSTALGIVNGSAGAVAARTFLLVTAHADGASGDTHQLRVSCAGDTSNTARSSTLPASADGLNMVLASCYYSGNTRLLAVAPMHREFLAPNPPPHVKMLCGDQIYLDLDFGGFYPRPLDAPWDDYQKQWYDERFLGWMANGGNLCMADDHEFWNNFPSEERAGVLSSIFKAPPEQVAAEMEQAFMIYQGVLNADPDDWLLKPATTTLVEDDLHCFEFPGVHAPAAYDPYFCMLVLDTRTRRTSLDTHTPPYQFTEPVWLLKTLSRLTQRNGPTLLVTSQSMLDKGGGSEANLADYSAQFGTLGQAIWNCPHQLLLLTGDIHWSRAQWFKNEGTGKKHYEIVSSALSRIHFAWDFHDLSKLQSKVTWGTQVVNATRNGDSDAPCNYAVLDFSTYDLGTHCRVRWFEIDGDGRHLPLNMTAGWSADLKTSMGLTRPLMQIPFDLLKE